MVKRITIKECKEDQHIYSFLRREINIDLDHKDITVYKCEKCGHEIIVSNEDEI